MKIRHKVPLRIESASTIFCKKGNFYLWKVKKKKKSPWCRQNELQFNCNETTRRPYCSILHPPVRILTGLNTGSLYSGKSVSIVKVLNLATNKCFFYPSVSSLLAILFFTHIKSRLLHKATNAQHLPQYKVIRQMDGHMYNRS